MKTSKEAQREYYQAYREKHRDKINARQREARHTDVIKAKDVIRMRARKARARDRFDEYMKDKSCIICGVADPRVLSWHHKDPTIKKDTIAQMVKGGYAWSSMMDEINKCVCICHNCHQLVHHYGVELPTH